MKSVIFRSLILLFIAVSYSSLAQIQVGSYTGMMRLVPTTLGIESVPVQLDIIQKNDTAYQFIMTYDSLLKKDYLLLDENSGEFKIQGYKNAGHQYVMLIKIN